MSIKGSKGDEGRRGRYGLSGPIGGKGLQGNNYFKFRTKHILSIIIVYHEKYYLEFSYTIL